MNIKTGLLTLAITLASFSVQADTGATGSTGNSGGSTDKDVAIGAVVAVAGGLGYYYSQRVRSSQVAPAKARVYHPKKRLNSCGRVKKVYRKGMKVNKNVKHRHPANGKTKVVTHTHSWTGNTHTHCYRK